MKDLIERLRNGLAITHRTRHKAADALEQAQQRIAELETKYECDCKEVHAARIYLRDQERLLREKAALALQVEQMLDLWDRLDEYATTSDDCQYGTLGTNFVRSFVADALALSTQPTAEIIAAHDAQVIERCAKVCDAEAESYGEPAWVQAATNCSDAIRALIAAPAYTPQAAKVSEKG